MSQESAKSDAWDPQDRGGSSPLRQLTLIRFREFLREPEAVFWTFGFPIVVSLALALAFPSRADRLVVVGLYAGADGDSLRATLKDSPGLAIRDVRPDDESWTT